MVALSCTTVARNGMSMVAWEAWWMFLLFSALAHAHGAPLDGKYGDVSGEDVVIDQLQDYLRAHRQGLRGIPKGLSPHQPPRHHQNLDEKIEFAVSPKDPRYYYVPISPVRDPGPPPLSPQVLQPPQRDVLRFLPPGEEEEEYPGDLLEYRGEDEVQYNPSYHRPYQQKPKFFPQQYLPLQEIQYPGGGGDLYPDPRLEDDGGAEEEVDDAREEKKRQMMLMDEVVEEEARKKEQPAAPDTPQLDETKAPPRKATSQPEAVNYMHYQRVPGGEAQPASYIQHNIHEKDNNNQSGLSDVYFTGLVAGCTALAVCGVIGAGICWYRLNKSHRATQDADYPAYGVTGPNKELSPSGDRKLAQSAHMYHYQHQKQQMIALDKSAGGERHGSASDVDSEEEGEENEYTVYECPGLAPTGEMEVKNPLFHDDPTPAATPSVRKEVEEEEEEEEEQEEEEINTK